MIGNHFLLLPINAIGILAVDNDDPLGYRESTSESYLFDISEISDDLLTLTARQVGGHAFASYLGAIVSADRQTVYWVNDSKPLP